MSILLFLLFGFVIGLLARALLPGNQQMGVLMTIVLGVAGSFVGGFLVSLVTRHRVTDFHTAGIIGSIVGAMVVLVIAGAVTRRGALA